ncbi:MAG: phage holin family protein [Bacteroidia bacterium]
MEEKNKIEELTGSIKQYVETRFDIIVLNLQDRISDVLSSVAATISVIVLGLFFILFLSAGLAWVIGLQLGNIATGFFSIAGVYLLLGLLVIANRDKWIKLPLINEFLKKVNINEKD